MCALTRKQNGDTGVKSPARRDTNHSPICFPVSQNKLKKNERRNYNVSAHWTTNPLMIASKTVHVLNGTYLPCKVVIKSSYNNRSEVLL